MKVILTKDTKDMGRAYDTINVSDGHGLNFLIPKKMAIPATPAAIKEAELRKRQMAAKHEIDTKLLTENLNTLSEKRIVIKMKVNEKGHLYDAVGEPEIRTAVQEQARIELPEGVIRLEKPIKEVGTFDVPVSAGKDFGKFSIIVEAE